MRPTVNGHETEVTRTYPCFLFSNYFVYSSLDPNYYNMKRHSQEIKYYWVSLAAQTVKNPSAMQETWVRCLGWEYLPEKGKARHCNILAWRIPWTIYSPWGRRVGCSWATFPFFHPTPRTCNSFIWCQRHCWFGHLLILHTVLVKLSTSLVFSDLTNNNRIVSMCCCC